MAYFQHVFFRRIHKKCAVTTSKQLKTSDKVDNNRPDLTVCK